MLEHKTSLFLKPLSLLCVKRCEGCDEEEAEEPL